MSSEDPEAYLRRFAETQLRRLAAGEAAMTESLGLLDSVAVAFEETGALDREVTARVARGLHFAFLVRSPGPGTPRAGRLGYSALRGLPSSTDVLGYRPRPLPRIVRHGASREAPPENVSVVPAGAVLRPRGDDGDEDVYLLAYVSALGRAWFSVAARTSEPLVPRRHASPPSARNPRVRPAAGYRPTFAGGGMTATDDEGRAYGLRFSGGGDEWYLGRLTVDPVPPPGTAWLEVHCGGESARIDLRAAPPTAEVTTRPLMAERGEDYLLRQAESLLGSPGPGAGLLTAKATGLSVAVPALRATGLLPPGSPVPGQVSALVERLGGPGKLIAEPGRLPERWAARAAGSHTRGSGPVAAASLAAILPETDGVTMHLSGLITLPGAGTTIFGGLRTASFPERSLWLRDDAGGWHSVSIQGFSRQGRNHVFQASVEPPVGPEVSRVEFRMTGTETEARADIPLTWWPGRAGRTA